MLFPLTNKFRQQSSVERQKDGNLNIILFHGQSLLVFRDSLFEKTHGYVRGDRGRLDFLFRLPLITQQFNMFIVPGTRLSGANIQASDLSQWLSFEIGDHNEDEEDDEIMKMMLMMTLVRIRK